MSRQRYVRFAIALSTLAASLAPVVATAHQPEMALSPERARTEFLIAGYQADEVMRWPGAGISSFFVTDSAEREAANPRILLVLVYPSVADAQAAYAGAAAAEEARHGYPLPSSPDRGPALIPGYSLSAWRANVAVVESTRDDLDRLYTANDEYAEWVSERPSHGVAIDVLSALNAIDIQSMELEA